MDTGPKFVSLEMEDSSKLKQGTYYVSAIGKFSKYISVTWADLNSDTETFSCYPNLLSYKYIFLGSNTKERFHFIVTWLVCILKLF